MGQEDSSRKKRGGKHFTYEQRVRMDTLIRHLWPHGKKINFAELGRLIDKAWTTVRREYARGEVANKDSQKRWLHHVFNLLKRFKKLRCLVLYGAVDELSLKICKSIASIDVLDELIIEYGKITSDGSSALKKQISNIS